MEEAIEKSRKQLKINVNILDAKKLSLDTLMDILKKLQTNLTKQEADLDQLFQGADSSIVILHILTTPEMPKRIYLEDLMQAVIEFISFSLKKFINSKEKTPPPFCAPKLKIFQKQIGISLQLLVKLVKKQELPELILFETIYISISVFYSKKTKEFHEHAQEILRQLFLTYKKYREAIFNDIWMNQMEIKISTRLTLNLIQTLGELKKKEEKNVKMQIKEIENAFNCFINVLTENQKIIQLIENLIQLFSNLNYPSAGWFLNYFFQHLKTIVLTSGGGKVRIDALDSLTVIANFFLLFDNKIDKDNEFLTNCENSHDFYFLRLYYVSDTKKRRVLIEKLKSEVRKPSKINFKEINMKYVNKFDDYLEIISKLFETPDGQLRVRAMRKLIQISDLKPDLLQTKLVRSFMQKYHLDNSALMRESTVELIGKCLLRTGFTDPYFQLLKSRLFDGSISVCKQVMKTLMQMCINQPDSKEIPMILHKILRRIQTEENLFKLAMDLFAHLWFVPGNSNGLIDLIVLCDQEDLLQFEKIIREQKYLRGIHQIIDKLLKELQTKEPNITSNIFNFIELVAKTHKNLLDKTNFMQLFNNQSSEEVIGGVAKILTQLLPFETKEMEELKQVCFDFVYRRTNQTIFNCLQCASRICELTAEGACALTFNCLQYYINQLKADKFEQMTIARALYTLGTLFHHFQLDDSYAIEVINLAIVQFNKTDELLKQFAIKTIGDVCLRHPKHFLNANIVKLYSTAFKLKENIVLETLTSLNQFLSKEPVETKEKLDLKEIDTDDVCNDIIQQYLSNILDLLIDSNDLLRHAALLCIRTAWHLRLLHPLQVIVQLIVISTDTDLELSSIAHRILLEMHTSFPQFTHARCLCAFKLAYEFHLRIGNGTEPPVNLDIFYSIFKSSKKQKHIVLSMLLKEFTNKTDVGYLHYLVMNLAHFNYTNKDEPLFILDKVKDVSGDLGDNFLSEFRSRLKETDACEEDETIDAICQRLEGASVLDLCRQSQGCYFLLILKGYLKKTYRLTDTDARRYTTECKLFDRTLKSKVKVKFEVKLLPDKVTDLVLAQYYVEFRDLMLEMDKEEAHFVRTSENKENMSKQLNVRMSKRKRQSDTNNNSA